MRWSVVAVTACGVFFGSCSKDDKAETPSETPHLDGAWHGVQSIVNADGSATESKKASFAFGLSQEFHMKLPDESQEATGTYTNFQRTKNLFLEIAESSVPTFGLKGTARDFTYDLADDELILKADKITYKLKREAETKAAPKALSGEWVGQDARGNDWRVVVDDGNFTAVVSRDRARSIMMSGAVTYLETSEAGEKAKCLFTVSRATPTKPVDFMLVSLRQTASFFKADETGKKLETDPLVSLNAQPTQ